jgi:S1-C subfamily serine protease
VDAFGGTLLGVLAVCVLAWLVVPVMTDAEGWPAASARGSLLARAVNSHLPEPPSQIQELERQLVGGDYPQLFEDLQQAPDIPAAPTGSPVSQEVLDSVAPSAVRLQSEACGQIQSGSGFFVGAGLVATNAHVVAGADGIELSSADGARGDGDVVAFDPAVDLALVRTDLERPALRLAPPEVGDQGLVLGFPGGGPFAPSPFEVGELIDARGFDIYDSSTVDRQVIALAAALEPGDSGSAVLRADGAVVGVAVAVAPDSTEVAYALNSSELRELLGASVQSTVSTGPCTS